MDVACTTATASTGGRTELASTRAMQIEGDFEKGRRLLEELHEHARRLVSLRVLVDVAQQEQLLVGVRERRDRVPQRGQRRV